MVWFLIAALASPLVVVDDPEGSLRERLVSDDADLVLLYGSEQEGEVGPCGCEAVERGGLARIEGYARAVRRSNAPVVLINAGGFLDARPGQDARNLQVLQALSGWDALHVGFRDAAGLGPVTGDLPAQAAPPSLVSASITGPWDPWTVVERGGVRVAITGVSPTTSVERFAPGLSASEPVEALRSAMSTAPDADLHVVLAYETGAVTDELAGVEGVDVLIEAGGYNARWDAVTDHGALWVRSTKGTTRLGELRLWLEDGAVAGAVDRQIDVDRALPKRRSDSR